MKIKSLIIMFLLFVISMILVNCSLSEIPSKEALDSEVQDRALLTGILRQIEFSWNVIYSNYRGFWSEVYLSNNNGPYLYETTKDGEGRQSYTDYTHDTGNFKFKVIIKASQKFNTYTMRWYSWNKEVATIYSGVYGLDYTPYKSLGSWNNNSDIKDWSNCYNYACNVKGHKHNEHRNASPGYGGGEKYTEPITESNITAAAVRDGLEFVGSNIAIPIPPEKKAVVALFIGVGARKLHFHFVRQDRSGYWSSKNGSEPATDKDVAGKPVTDPRKADWGVYFDTFVGYFYVPSANTSGNQFIGTANIK